MAQPVDIQNAFSTFSEDAWDGVIDDLEKQGGVTTVQVPLVLQELHATSFATARQALDLAKETPNVVEAIAPEADSGHATGFHTAGGMSRYNAHREGFVFSDGGNLTVEGMPQFEPGMRQLFGSLHGISTQVLRALERKLELPANWFQKIMGPTDNSSQWHVKRFVEAKEFSTETKEPATTKDADDENILLPMHTDPSIISIVIHDSPGSNPGAMGLEYYVPGEEKRTWTEVPLHGHAVATILVGSVLSHITGGKWPSVKHRVVKSETQDRMAATLFARPKGSSILQVPPSPLLHEVSLKKKMTFGTWNARVSKNYMKKKNGVPSKSINDKKNLSQAENRGILQG
jgi:isopenicillin N synthase-like dioxygenase